MGDDREDIKFVKRYQSFAASTASELDDKANRLAMDGYEIVHVVVAGTGSGARALVVMSRVTAMKQSELSSAH